MTDGRKRRKELLQYYGNSGEDVSNTSYDINSKHFNQDMYVQKVIKEKNLKHLLDEESNLVYDVQRLDSDCQTLVYDHYDKFIAATDIVRKMKEGSVQMETEMSHLQNNMVDMTQSSSSITSALQDRRQNLSRLLGIHSTLKKLEFLFKLPIKIDECISENKFSEAVRCYVETAEVIQRYHHLPSFSAIHKDCEAALSRLNQALKDQLAVKDGTAHHLTQCVDLLLQLGEPADGLCDDFLSHVATKLRADLVYLENLAETSALPPSHNAVTVDQEVDGKQEEQKYLDILQFMDVCHDTFVGNLWLIISSYKEMFLRNASTGQHGTIKPNNINLTTGQHGISNANNVNLAAGKDGTINADDVALGKLCTFVNGLVFEYIAVVGIRVTAEEDTGDYSALATALDKFHRRLHAITQLLPKTDFADASLQLVVEASAARCNSSLDWLKAGFLSSLADVREAVAGPRHVTQDASSSPSSHLNELLTRLVATTAANIKNRLSALLTFNQPKYTFAMRSEFRSRFCGELVREGVVVAFFIHITESLTEFCHKKDKDPVLILLLSRMCLDLHTSTVHYLLSHCDCELQLEDKTGLTSLATITGGMKDAGQHLLNHYVTTQGAAISQMLRRSVELKDWLGCGEPRSVRRVMRTVRDEIASIDAQVGALYEEGNRRERSSDSSRRTYHSYSLSAMRGGAGGARSSTWPSYTPSHAPSQQLDNSLVANLNKLWSERIEIFASVEFTRMSIMTGIVKISLKTLLESVRLRTLGRFGLQQVQVDTHYLRTYLWSYVADEQVLYVLLDEVLTSASVRCLDPELMEHKVVEFICEQN